MIIIAAALPVIPARIVTLISMSARPSHAKTAVIVAI